MRGEESYASDDAMRFAALVLVHEIGHQLLHLGHPFGQLACVMNPAPLLRFREWASQLSAQNCPPASSGGMKPGAAKIRILN